LIIGGAEFAEYLLNLGMETMWHVQDWKLGLNSVLVGMDWRTTLVLVVALYVVYEQLSYISKRKHLPGPLFVLPFIGNVIAMVVDPTRFWDQQAVAARKVSRMAMTFSMSVLLERSVSFSVSSIFKMRTFHSDESLHIYTHELVHLGTLKFLTDSLSLGLFPLGIATNIFAIRIVVDRKVLLIMASLFERLVSFVFLLS